MNKEIAFQIMREYEKKQDDVIREIKRKTQEVYSKIPLIEKIDAELSKISLYFIKNSFYHPDKSQEYIVQLKKKINTLKEKKIHMLTANGYPPDYLEPKYQCQDCKDTGFVDGKKCHCYKRRLIEICYEKSNLKEVLKTHNFNNFRLDFYSEDVDPEQGMSPRQNMQQILERSRKFIQSFGENDGYSFLFYGRSGLGKTFLSYCIAKELLDRGYVVLYLTSTDLFDILREFKLSDDDYTDEHIQMIFDSDLLILDDLGTEPLTGFTLQELFNVINKRLIHGKRMIVSTNLTLDEITSYYPERIYSRLLGNFKLFYFFGEDIRLKKRDI
ncbi:ATP-binding protein [Caldanaerobius polysaccharolyticus]|uniref:ATP-binding protein n=1 Tax=Caldanaerobius polysaccharolyticus TaxID=44256 RepID=UPI000479E6A3|nr:ATP-binding protein [Caldanaerobius polysaccharolyticus]